MTGGLAQNEEAQRFEVLDSYWNQLTLDETNVVELGIGRIRSYVDNAALSKKKRRGKTPATRGVCSTSGCVEPVAVRGFCGHCYMRGWRLGTISVQKRQPGPKKHKKIRDLSNQFFGRLRVVRIADSPRTKHGVVNWECLCTCGKTTVVTAYNLLYGRVRSCGCLKVDAGRASATHGHTRGWVSSPTYRTWRSMMQRCHDPGYISFHQYGAAGISVCDRWQGDFNAFLSDMGERPDGHTLDRINSAGNYEPDNCRWATPTEQARNRRPPSRFRPLSDRIERLEDQIRSLGAIPVP